MIKKELHFGAAEITVSKSGKKVLTIDEHIGFSIMQVIVSDAEILEDDNSPEVILMEITGRKPSQKTVAKIEKSLHSFAEEIRQVHFV